MVYRENVTWICSIHHVHVAGFMKSGQCVAPGHSCMHSVWSQAKGHLMHIFLDTVQF